MRCADCIWYDADSRECIIKGYKVLVPNIPRVCPFRNKVPELAKNYLNSVTELTELSQEVVRSSEPFKNFLKKFRLTRL